MKKQALSIGLAALLTVCTLGCASADDTFNKQIAALPYTTSSLYVNISSMEELMAIAKPNLIVKCEITSREDPTIVDVSGKHTVSDIQSASELSDDEKTIIAGSYLSTPYECSVQEVFLGDALAAGDAFTINAPYGIFEGYERRDGKFPILKVDSDYLMFLRVDQMYGQNVYTLAFPPASALELTDESFSGEYGDFVDTVFGEYEGSLSALTEALETLIAENDYDLAMDIVG